MTTSYKEKILDVVEQRMNEIKKGNIAHSDIYYQNDVGYVDRQYKNITLSDIKKNGTNWIVINTISETFKPLIGGDSENSIQLQIVGFVQAQSSSENLDSLMNSLQKDIILAMLKGVELNGMCSYLQPREVVTSSNLKYPYGGFSITFDIVYITRGLHY